MIVRKQSYWPTPGYFRNFNKAVEERIPINQGKAHKILKLYFETGKTFKNLVRTFFTILETREK